MLFAVSLSLLPAATAADFEDEEWMSEQLSRQRMRRESLRAQGLGVQKREVGDKRSFHEQADLGSGEAARHSVDTALPFDIHTVPFAIVVDVVFSDILSSFLIGRPSHTRNLFNSSRERNMEPVSKVV